MKKIKKWQMLALVVFGIVVYFLLQNMWFFEKNISIESYKVNLEAKEWIDSKNVRWNFNKGKLTQSNGSSKATAKYKLEGNELIIEKDRIKFPLKMKIIKFKQSVILLKPDFPSTNGNSPTYIKLTNEN